MDEVVARVFWVVVLWLPRYILGVQYADTMPGGKNKTFFQNTIFVCVPFFCL